MNKKISVIVSIYLILSHWNANKWILDGDIIKEIVIEIINKTKIILIDLFVLIIFFVSSKKLILNEIKIIIINFKNMSLL